jgi:HSP20 family protein
MPWRQYRTAFRHLEYDMHRFAEDALRAFMESPGGPSKFWQPAADVHETEAGVVIKLEVAGILTESLSVTLAADGRRLTVSGSRSESLGECALRQNSQLLEIYYGPFERIFELPEEVIIDRDAITATLKNGFLTILMPPRATESGAVQKIPIATG